MRRDATAWLAQDGEGKRSQFPEGDGPFAVDRPTISKASYLHVAVGETRVFLVPPLARTIPVQVLVIGDEERFSVGDLLGLATLSSRLRAWREGP